jgi:hypothetical protein
LDFPSVRIKEVSVFLCYDVREAGNEGS